MGEGYENFTNIFDRSVRILDTTRDLYKKLFQKPHCRYEV